MNPEVWWAAVRGIYMATVQRVGSTERLRHGAGRELACFRNRPWEPSNKEALDTGASQLV